MEKKELVLKGKMVPTIDMKHVRICTCSDCNERDIDIILELNITVKKEDLIKLIEDLKDFDFEVTWKDDDYDCKEWELVLKEV